MDTASRSPRLESAVDKASGILIGLSLVILPLETWTDAPAWIGQTVVVWELAVIWLFGAEYLLRIWLAPVRWRYLVSFYGLLDAVTILPPFLAPGLGLQELRALRLLRLLRLAKSLRYTRSVQRFGRALAESRDEAVVFVCATGVVLYVASIGIWIFEHEAQPEAFATIFHALWWAVATLTTVGYGDIYPITTGGRIFTAGIAFISLGVVASLAGMVASALTKAAAEREDERATSTARTHLHHPHRDTRRRTPKTGESNDPDTD